MKQQDDIYNAIRVIAAALADAETDEDRFAAGVYLKEICNRPGDVEELTEKLIRVLSFRTNPAPKKRVTLRLVGG